MLPEWLDLAFADRDRIDAVIAQALQVQPNISENEFRKFVESRARAVQSIAAFIVSNMTFQEGEDIAAKVSELAAQTFAYYLADDATKERLVDFFIRIARAVAESTDEPQRFLIRRSPLPPAAVSELQTWLTGNVEALRAAIADDDVLDAVSATALQYANARSINAVSDRDVVPIALSDWIAGKSYASIHTLLSRRNVRIGVIGPLSKMQ